METVNVKIDVSTPRGRKLIRELYGQKGVEIENPMPAEFAGKTYTVDEVFDRVRAKIKKHYGVE